MRKDPKLEESYSKYETLMGFAKTWVPGKEKRVPPRPSPIPGPPAPNPEPQPIDNSQKIIKIIEEWIKQRILTKEEGKKLEEQAIKENVEPKADTLMNVYQTHKKEEAKKVLVTMSSSESESNS